MLIVKTRQVIEHYHFLDVNSVDEATIDSAFTEGYEIGSHQVSDNVVSGLIPSDQNMLSVFDKVYPALEDEPADFKLGMMNELLSTALGAKAPRPEAT